MRNEISTAAAGNTDRHPPVTAPMTEFAVRIRFDAAACLSVRYPDLDCGLCASACPTSAIVLDERRPTLVGECVGCGSCAAACPTSSLSSDGFALPPALPGATASVDVDCWRVPLAASPRGALRVPCLGGAGVGWLLAACELAGARPLRLLDRGACAGCPAAGEDRIEAALHEARQLLAAAGVADDSLPIRLPAREPAALLPAIPDSAAACAVDRRGFFRGLVGGVARGAETIAAARTPAAVLSLRRGKVAPVGRLRVVAALSRIAARQARPVPPQVMPWLSHTGCDAQGICAVVCPTGALRQHAPADERALELHFNPALCIACGQCAQVCPERALRLSPAGGELTDTILARWQSRSCDGCGDTFFAADGALCAACIKKLNLQQGMAALFRPFA